VEITDVFLGENAPEIIQIRRGAGVTEDMALSGDADLHYKVHIF
jgi:hypothetical protein